MATTIVFKDNYEITIDATLSRRHNRSAQVTKHKVSKGSDISDHVISDNKKFSLEGVISEFTRENNISLADATFEKIEEAIETGEIVKVKSKRKNYDNLIITGFDCTDSVDKGYSLVFSLDFEQIRFAEAKTEKRDLIKFPPQKKNAGKTSKEKPTKKQQDKINKKVTKPKSAKTNQISRTMFAR